MTPSSMSLPQKAAFTSGSSLDLDKPSDKVDFNTRLTETVNREPNRSLTASARQFVSLDSRSHFTHF